MGDSQKRTVRRSLEYSGHTTDMHEANAAGEAGMQGNPQGRKPQRASMTVSGAMEQAVYWDVSMTLREAVQLAEVRALRDIITKMETWCRILDADLTDMQDKLRRRDG